MLWEVDIWGVKLLWKFNNAVNYTLENEQSEGKAGGQEDHTTPTSANGTA